MTGDDVRKLRIDHLKWPQRQLADYLGVRQATVSRIETKKAKNGVPKPIQRLLEQLRSDPSAGSQA